MKKTFAWIITLMMVLCMGGAVAEIYSLQTASTIFDVEITLPDGVEATQRMAGDIALLSFTLNTDNGAQLEFKMSVAPGEELLVSKLSELSAENLEALIGYLTESFHHATYAILPLADGNIVIVMEENDAYSDYAMFFTVYEGYCFNLYVNNADYSEMAIEAMDIAYQMITSLKVIPVN